ncbi:MAG: hypothetical protein ACOYNF_14780 [Rhodoferax sp.]
MTHHAPNWLLATLIACALSASCLLDGPSEVQAIQASADTVADAQLQVRQTARFDRAAQRLCQGGGYVLIGRAEIACTTGAGGRKVLSVKVAL